LAEGCPCEPAEPTDCYDGPDGTAGVGECRPGLRACEDGEWSGCSGEVVPAEEICDGRDEDCDGTVDDGAVSACGDCAPDCRERTLGPEGEVPFDPGADLALDAAGDLVLAGDTYSIRLVWVPNSLEGTISRIDTATRTEQARYRTGPLGASPGFYDPPGDNPSRTSVDYRGDLYVANRAFAGQASVTKIREHDCPDTDGDGVVETSTGRDDVLPWGTDECVAWNTPVGESGAIARAIAYQARDEGGGAREVVWTGLYDAKRFVELDAESGEPTGVELDASPCMPYGAAIDRDGTLWSAGPVTCRFDTADPDAGVEPLSQPSYGITVDGDGRVWIGGDVGYFDPETEIWTMLPDVSGYGIAADETSVWVGGCRIARGFTDPWSLCRVDLESLEAHEIDVRVFGVAVDFDGAVWGFDHGHYVASVVDPETESVDDVLHDCGDGTSFCLDGPYAYADMTGFQLHNATNPVGIWSAVVDGCGDGTEARWVALRWEATTPPGTRVALQVRAGEDAESLARRDWIDVATTPPDASPVPLSDAFGDGGRAVLVEVRATLYSDVHGESPALHEIGLLRSCGAPIG
jgi:hypothetical protein